MGVEYRTVKGEVVFELVEKRSRFIASLDCVSSQAMAQAYLSKIKKKHYSAKHNVYAYVLASGQEKFSDDGEPSGTGGQPVLDVLKKNSLLDVVCVVSRYFGGILLGRGGLLRAYSAVASKAVEDADFVKMVACDYCKITCDYSLLGSVLSVLKKYGFFLDNKVFTQSVELYGFSALLKTGLLSVALEDVSCGKIGFEILSRRIRKVG